MEQLPVDLSLGPTTTFCPECSRPAPTLFIYNHADDCCFRTARARSSLVEPPRRVSRPGSRGMMEAYGQTSIPARITTRGQPRQALCISEQKVSGSIHRT